MIIVHQVSLAKLKMKMVFCESYSALPFILLSCAMYNIKKKVKSKPKLKALGHSAHLYFLSV